MADEYGSTYYILQFTDIPRPGIFQQCRLCQEQWISVSDLNLEISLPKEEETQWTEEEKEKALLLQTLEKTGDNRSKAARLLNVSRTTLYEKLRKYHIID